MGAERNKEKDVSNNVSELQLLVSNHSSPVKCLSVCTVTPPVTSSRSSLHTRAYRARIGPHS